jgi:hypothetical protein
MTLERRWRFSLGRVNQDLISAGGLRVVVQKKDVSWFHSKSLERWWQSPIPNVSNDTNKTRHGIDARQVLELYINMRLFDCVSLTESLQPAIHLDLLHSGDNSSIIVVKSKQLAKVGPKKNT